MEIFSLILARAACFFPLDSLNPFGKISAAEVLKGLCDRYQFAQAPEHIPEITAEKGVAFLSGKLGGVVIERLTLYPNGIVVDTRSSTLDSEKIAQDIIETSRQLLGSKTSVERRHFTSQFTFRSQMNLAKMNPVIDEIISAVESSLASGLKQSFLVEPTALTIHVDTSQARISPAKFTIERLAESPFSEDLYFTSAPVHSPLHVELVRKFEESLL